MQEKIRGTLVAWKQDKAYGFIRPSAGGKDVFVHLRDIGDIGRSPKIGDVLWFQRLADGTGRYRATAVHVEGTTAQALPKRKPRSSRPPIARPDEQLRAGANLWIALGFLGMVVGLAAVTALPYAAPNIAVSLVAVLMWACTENGAAIIRGLV